jgi:AraC-like DNA-binding protein
MGFKSTYIPLEKAVVYKTDFSGSAPITVNHKQLHPLTYKNPHFNLHDEWEMGIVVSGVYQDIHSDYKNNLKPGGLWWCGPWEPHGYFGPGPVTWIIGIGFLPSVFAMIPPEDPLSQLVYLPFLRPETRPLLQPKTPAQRAALVRRFRAIHRTHAAGGPFALSAVKLQFFELLLDLLRDYDGDRPLPAIPERSLTERVITVLGFLHRNLGSKITLDQAAASVSLSRMQLWRVFRRVMGVTFTDYLLQARLKKAHAEILEGREKLSVIARNCGFSAGHLFKVYTRHYGHTPGQERNS